MKEDLRFYQHKVSSIIISNNLQSLDLTLTIDVIKEKREQEKSGVRDSLKAKLEACKAQLKIVLRDNEQVKKQLKSADHMLDDLYADLESKQQTQCELEEIIQCQETQLKLADSTRDINQYVYVQSQIPLVHDLQQLSLLQNLIMQAIQARLADPQFQQQNVTLANGTASLNN